MGNCLFYVRVVTTYGGQRMWELVLAILILITLAAIAIILHFKRK